MSQIEADIEPRQVAPGCFFSTCAKRNTATLAMSISQVVGTEPNSKICLPSALDLRSPLEMAADQRVLQMEGLEG